ncbi:hypothetical protein [Streptomyces halstedii]|uniref:Uncharacterized protein n=1 Tax=Streptomyces halstedii TaxID=1944 RepID=A0A6N9UAX1_STRHA|nr:hypothetical protein [Streptomyces halstedii]NEA19832.1 hypothetical protein [Streptomyces halstedii]
MTEQPEPRPDAEQLAAAVEQLHAIRAYVAALAPAVVAMAAQLQRLTRQAEYALAPPPDRPAWQSPHGPAHTRRKEQRP